MVLASFNSVEFLIFFPIAVFLYFSIPHRFRWLLLLTASYYFYMSWKPEYGILIAASTLISYLAARFIGSTGKIPVRRFMLVLSLLASLGLLFAFKYFNFVSDSMRDFLSLFSIHFSQPVLNVLLPLGISFYTFQTLGYTIDVYNRKVQPEKHLGIFALYVSFFPQLVAGPIERAGNLIPQFFERHYFDYKEATDGLKLMLWGFFKKVVIADRLAIIVNVVYNNVGDYTGIPLILATFFFAFQIYCDFSGYSDIAIGGAKVMGFRLMDNFNRPYHATSIADFWRRWHISLTSWFRDYIYIPLGGNRVSLPRWYFNIMIVFLVSGIWHGADWTFIVWGLIHGFYSVFSLITKNTGQQIALKAGLARYPKMHGLFQLAVTFTFVTFAWIFFRANSLSDAVYVVANLFRGWSLNFSGVNIGVGWFGLFYAFGLIFFLEFIHMMQRHVGMRQFLSEKPLWMRWLIYLILILAILLLGVFGENVFIYFQF